MKTKPHFLQILLIGFLAFGVSSAATWKPAPNNPPSSNTDAPINVSSTAQTKTGSFTSTASITGNIVKGTSQLCIGNDCRSEWPGGSGSADSSVGVPAGAVMAFNLSSCPAGWIALDGTSGRPDLRGRYIRGLASDRTVGQYQSVYFYANTESTQSGSGRGKSFMKRENISLEPANISFLYCQKT